MFGTKCLNVFINPSLVPAVAEVFPRKCQNPNMNYDINGINFFMS